MPKTPFKNLKADQATFPFQEGKGASMLILCRIYKEFSELINKKTNITEIPQHRSQNENHISTYTQTHRVSITNSEDMVLLLVMQNNTEQTLWNFL